jgi:hypothetical protein
MMVTIHVGPRLPVKVHKNIQAYAKKRYLLCSKYVNKSLAWDYAMTAFQGLYVNGWKVQVNACYVHTIKHTMYRVLYWGC